MYYFKMYNYRFYKYFKIYKYIQKYQPTVFETCIMILIQNVINTQNYIKQYICMS